MKFNQSVLVAVALLSSPLTGCENVKDELGLSRHSPDEFAVMQRAPLEVPQDLSTLPAPMPGAQRPQEIAAKVMAKEAVLGDESSADAAQSATEKALLKKTGAVNAANDIRATVNREAAEDTEDNRPTVKKILDIGSSHTAATVVDPAAESQRILDAKKKGQVVTGADTPTRED